MGEYFDWVNVDKKEFISPSDFGYGNKLHETMHRDSDPLLALHSLLAERWAGDHILFLGDECNVPEDTHNYVYELLTRQYKLYPDGGFTWDMVFDTYRNISGLFKEAENEVRREISFFLEELNNYDEDVHNEYGVDINDPFEGLFTLTGCRRRYVLNHTQKMCYSLEESKILYLDHTEAKYSDPLPILLCFGGNCDPGSWIGDSIGVDEEIPEGYTLLKEIFLDW